MSTWEGESEAYRPLREVSQIASQSANILGAALERIREWATYVRVSRGWDETLPALEGVTQATAHELQGMIDDLQNIARLVDDNAPEGPSRRIPVGLSLETND